MAESTASAPLSADVTAKFAEFARAGGLLSYGPSLLGAARQVGFMAGKVLAGSTPATMPIERPSKFELILNRRTAEAGYERSLHMDRASSTNHAAQSAKNPPIHML